MSKILLVEDNEYNREMLTKRLQRAGFAVVAAADGREGLDMARSEAPDLIVMDLDLPEIDGWEATRRLKANPATSRIPVIALTAHAMHQDLKKAVESGCNHFETKPVMFTRLLGKINGCLDIRT
jgi:two-component system, cell cycle response regulator DivK